LTVPRLYHPNSSLAPGQIAQLDAKTSHHVIRVLRLRKNSEVILFNGDGNEYLSELVDENTKHCSVRINSIQTRQTESPINIILMQGISRGDRMDTSIQKATELGVNVIIPVICERTQVRLNHKQTQKKCDHWQQVIISACEQSGRCVIPELTPVITYDEALNMTSDCFKIILNPESKAGIKSLEQPVGNICLMVGPEGGLSQNEIDQAIENNFKQIQFGPRILRTETAGPACIAAIQTLWGDLC